MGQLIPSKKEPEVKKHVATIHCANTLSLLQRKISNALLYHAYHHLLSQEEHAITIKQLCNIIGYQGNNQGAIKDALRGLITTLIEWNVVDNTGEEDWSASSILASVRIKGPHCTYAYSPRMRELLRSPSMYGKINLIVQARFRSSYGLALYENCIRYKGLPHTKSFELAAFRKLMGVPEEIYPNFRNFKQRVLDKSIDEVNTYSDLRIEPEINRVGRKVISIRFKLKERQKKMPLGKQEEQQGRAEELNYSEPDMGLINKLKADFGLSTAQLDKLIANYSFGVIAKKIELIEDSNNYKQGKINNLAAYLLKALKEDYQPPKASAHKLKSKQQVEYEAELAEKRLSREYNNYKINILNTALDQLNEDVLIGLKEEFYKKYNCRPKQSEAGYSPMFRNFIRESYPELVPACMSFEEFTSQCLLEGNS
jgi:hypothetical protein